MAPDARPRVGLEACGGGGLGAPSRKGYGRYFENLGYTWVSLDSWGWVPYHNGRWTRKEDLGWVHGGTIQERRVCGGAAITGIP
jgi:hypothetical protein